MCTPIVYLSQRSHALSDQREALSGSVFLYLRKLYAGKFSYYFMQQISYDFMKNTGKDAVQNLAHCK